VVFGVRPEHVTVAPDGQGAPFHVDLVEPLGQELLVYASAGGAEVTARLAPGTRVASDTPVRFAFAQEGMNFFDAGTKKRIEGSSSRA
jgi:multiple sugar transport system ATP-binding protein